MQLAALAETDNAANRHRKVVIVSAIGTAVEWYDFFVYAIVAPLVFDTTFFPKFDHFVATLLVYSTFAVGFVARPLGGFVFGYFGDRYDRKSVLVTTLILMGVASTGIGLVPNYKIIGLWAPLLLVSFRFLQGFALGDCRAENSEGSTESRTRSIFRMQQFLRTGKNREQKVNEKITAVNL